MNRMKLMTRKEAMAFVAAPGAPGEDDAVARIQESFLDAALLEVWVQERGWTPERSARACSAMLSSMCHDFASEDSSSEEAIIWLKNILEGFFGVSERLRAEVQKMDKK